MTQSTASLSIQVEADNCTLLVSLCPVSRPVIRLAACADAVFAVAWNPAQPDMAASGGGDDKAYIWKVHGFALGMHSSIVSCELHMMWGVWPADRPRRTSCLGRPYRFSKSCCL